MDTQPCHPSLAVEGVEGATVVTFTVPTVQGEETIKGIGEHLSALAEKAEYPRLVLDFSRVHYFGSGMLARLVNLHKQTEALGGGLALCALSPHLKGIFEATRLNEFFALYPDREAALKAW